MPQESSLLLGDCFDRLRGLSSASVEMILTDPPYGMSFVSNYRKKKLKQIENDKDLRWLPAFVDEAHRIAKPNTAHCVFCSWHQIDLFKVAFAAKFVVKDIMIWVKNNTSMGDLTGTLAPCYEMILLLHKGRKEIEGKRADNVIRAVRTGNKLHPTQKPVDLLYFLVEKFSTPGGTVLDPFMGSGSTGVAALQAGRGFIGIEIDEDYYKIAKGRVAGAHGRNDTFSLL